MAKRLIFFIDFDGTISTEDVCYGLVKNFARNGWEELNDLWEKGEVSTAECAQQTLDLIDASPEELNRFYNTMSIDDSFVDFTNWASSMSFPLYILSDGYDNYIELLLRKYNLNIDYFANHLDYKEGWHIKMPYYNSECGQCGACKTSLIEKLQPPDYTSVYIGDGWSDHCPAEKCDIVFAKDRLALYCREKGIPFYPFKSFYDIQNILQGEAKMGKKML